MNKKLCKSCGSCGFPMRTPQDHAGGNVDADICSTCGQSNGTLKPFDDAVEANAAYLVNEQGIDMQAARAMARALLASMPAWKSGVG
ncbi:MAG: zinc ribbon domain-containing protein [Burkholderiaceae bacterium]